MTMNTSQNATYTDEQALRDIREFLDERAAAGVFFAKTISELTLREGRLIAIFDPKVTAGISTGVFRELCPFDNLAQFVGSPAGWKTDEAARIRSRISRVETYLADGESLGSMTAADLYNLATSEDLLT